MKLLLTQEWINKVMSGPDYDEPMVFACSPEILQDPNNLITQMALIDTRIYLVKMLTAVLNQKVSLSSEGKS